MDIGINCHFYNQVVDTFILISKVLRIYFCIKSARCFYFYSVGILADVSEILDWISGMEKDSRWCRGELKRRFEKTLSDVCRDYTSQKLTHSALVDLIIAGERFELDTLLQSAIELAARCTTNSMNKCLRYHEISAEIKSKITEKRLYYKENFSDLKPVYLLNI